MRLFTFAGVMVLILSSSFVMAQPYDLDSLTDPLSPKSSEYFNILQKKKDPALTNALLSKMTTSKNTQVRIHCARILLAADNTPTLRKSYLDAFKYEKETRAKTMLAMTIGHRRITEALPELKKYVLSEGNNDYMMFESKGVCIQSLGQLGKVSTPVLTSFAANTQLMNLYSTHIMYALGMTGEESVVPLLMNCTKSNNEMTKTAAIIALTERFSNYSPATQKSILNTLILLSEDSSAQVRQSVAQSLGQSKAKGAIPYLEKMLEDSYRIKQSHGDYYYPVRDMAKNALIEINRL